MCPSKIHIDGNLSKPRISKMHNVQEAQKTVSLLLINGFETFSKHSSYVLLIHLNDVN